MVKVKLLVARTGGKNAGDEVEVTADEAKRMVDKGQAVLVRRMQPEKSVKKRTAEKAAK